MLSASVVLTELHLLTKSHPHLVGVYMEEVEPAIVKTIATFRAELKRPVEVIGWPTTTLDAEAPDQESVHSSIPAAWVDILPATKRKTVVASKVVLLPDLLGNKDTSPFHSIVSHCGASVFGSKLLALIVQSKWEENVRSQRYWSFFFYGGCFVEGAAAMMMSSIGGRSLISVDVLQGVMVLFESVALGMEGFQLKREGIFYFTGPWNMLDLGASICLLAGD